MYYCGIRHKIAEFITFYTNMSNLTQEKKIVEKKIEKMLGHN